jgi:hypothetical protein
MYNKYKKCKKKDAFRSCINALFYINSYMVKNPTTYLANITTRPVLCPPLQTLPNIIITLLTLLLQSLPKTLPKVASSPFARRGAHLLKSCLVNPNILSADSADVDCDTLCLGHACSVGNEEAELDYVTLIVGITPLGWISFTLG